MVDRSSKSSFFNASLAHGRPFWVALAHVTKRSICFSDPTQLLFLSVMMRIILFPEKISSACSILLAHGPHHEQHVSDM